MSLRRQVGGSRAAQSIVTYLTARELSHRIKYKPLVINNMLKDELR